MTQSTECLEKCCCCRCDSCEMMIDHCHFKPNCNVSPDIQGKKMIFFDEEGNELE